MDSSPRPTPTTPAPEQDASSLDLSSLAASPASGLSWMDKLTHIVRMNKMRLKRRMGLPALMRLMLVLDNPENYEPEAREAWAKEIYEGLFRK